MRCALPLYVRTAVVPPPAPCARSACVLRVYTPLWIYAPLWRWLATTAVNSAQRPHLQPLLDNNPSSILWNSRFVPDRVLSTQEPVTVVVQCQSPCGPTADMLPREHPREAKRKDLGEESTRLGQRGAQNKIFRQARSCLRAFPARHTLNSAVPCYLTKAGGPTRGPQPQQPDIALMTEEEPVCESMRSGLSRFYFFQGMNKNCAVLRAGSSKMPG